MSIETTRLIRDGENGGRGYGSGGRGILCPYRYTVTTRMTPALRWAAMRGILMFHNCERQSHKTVSTDHNFWRERRAEADSNRGPSVYQPNALPLGHSGSPFHRSSSFRWCLMASDVGWHMRDKLRPMREHGSILLYVHGNHKAR